MQNIQQHYTFNNKNHHNKTTLKKYHLENIQQLLTFNKNNKITITLNTYYFQHLFNTNYYVITAIIIIERMTWLFYHDEGLVVQGGGCLMHPSALLQVLLQSQRVDGEEGHVWLMDTKTDS